ncbi:SPFH domain-containing protein [Paludibaculum fermentans]|uniref:SPFH domain-containing protein n=1 Tax=Paludibaculum fermentans TaxID=1473598 RepID=A0A7S7NXZ5_PALFE|nr:SPFH domain-containing protein [Paludibaculum fermentans]QOY91849.1 SPFH domain-containing protein [Paludibaculum fermentans]
MALGDQIKSFLKKQFIDVIQWTDQEDGVLAYRYPMQDMEIQNGAQLTVRESQAAMFVNEGRCADIFSPGLYTLNTRTLPLLTNLQNWDKMFASPFKSDVFYFSTRQQIAQRWGTAQPVTIRDKDFGAIRLRGFGVYSWHVDNPKLFLTKVSGFGEVYRVSEVEPQLRQTIVGRMSDAFAESQIPFLDMAANLVEVGDRIKASITPVFAELGIAIDQFVVENLSLPEELQKFLDTRVGMNMIGNMQQYTQFQAANSLPIAAANEGGGLAGLGVGLGAGVGLGQVFSQAMNPQAQQPPQAPPPVAPQAAPPVVPVVPVAGAAAVPDTKFCSECGQKIPRASKFCPECGKPQQ